MSAVVLPVVQWGITGEGGRRALLIHGLSSSAHVWWRVGSELSDLGWEVVAPDLRGHGNAPRTVSYRLDGFVADVHALGSGWDVVVGHSLGGAVALLAALEPSFCRRLVLLDPVVQVPEEEWDEWHKLLLSELEAQSADELMEQNPRWSSEDAFIKLAAIRAVSPRTVAAVLDDNRPWDLRSRVAGLAVPTLLIGADSKRGGLVTEEMGRELASVNPMVEWESVMDVGHSIQRERPDLVVRVVAASGS